MNTNMLFSIIVPLYNKASYIEKALCSIAAQTFKDYELIVVDDGSTDDSAVIAEKCMREYWHACASIHIKFIRQANAGVSTARNNGVSAASGAYICFLDADDWWAPNFLEEMSKLISEFPDAGIYGTNYVIVNENKRKTRVAPIGVETGFEKGYINYCKVYADTLAMPLWTGAVAIPRRIFDEMCFNPLLKLGEDFDLWIRVALKSKVVFLNEPLAYYNQDVEPTSRGTRIHKPQHHMLWNLDYLCNEEKTNPDYKRLIDNLRTYSLFPYYISREYHELAKEQLAKVDWGSQKEKWVNLYKMPLWYLRLLNDCKKAGSRIKQLLLRIA